VDSCSAKVSSAASNCGGGTRPLDTLSKPAGASETRLCVRTSCGATVQMTAASHTAVRIERRFMGSVLPVSRVFDDVQVDRLDRTGAIVPAGRYRAAWGVRIFSTGDRRGCEKNFMPRRDHERCDRETMNVSRGGVRDDGSVCGLPATRRSVVRRFVLRLHRDDERIEHCGWTGDRADGNRRRNEMLVDGELMIDARLCGCDAEDGESLAVQRDGVGAWLGRELLDAECDRFRRV